MVWYSLLQAVRRVEVVLEFKRVCTTTVISFLKNRKKHGYMIILNFGKYSNFVFNN